MGSFFGIAFAVLQMDSPGGQAITSTQLGILAGGTVGALAAIPGCAVGVVLKRTTPRL